LNKWGDIEINGNTSQTSEMNIFAGGDCVTGPATVIQAVAAGRHAAENMDSFLMKGYIKEQHIDYSCSRGSMEDLPKWEFEEMPKINRSKMPEISLEERANNFREVELGYSEQTAIEEARRCLKCGCHERYQCDLRKEASAHNIEFAKPVHDRPYIPIVRDHPVIIRDHNKCISCGRCIAAVQKLKGPIYLPFT
jgi:formate dehydrogenase major subunit